MKTMATKRMMRMSILAPLLLACVLLPLGIDGFRGSSPQSNGRIGHRSNGLATTMPSRPMRPAALTLRDRMTTVLASSNDPNSNDNSRGVRAVRTTSIPFASYFLLAITVRSLAQLCTLPTELPGAFFAPGGLANLGQIDWIGTAFDVFFVGFGVQNVLQQNGLLGGSAGASASSGANALAGLECRVTLDVGREPGTMMESEWGGSGARLLLPVNLKLSTRPLEIDFPGEEAMGGRFCYELDVLEKEVTFVGPQGQVRVPIAGGGWTVLPIPAGEAAATNQREGQPCRLRMFLDFPEGAERNDVSLPAGRIFFSGVAFGDAAGLSSGEGVVLVPESPGGVLNNGRLTYKRNGWLNLFGAFGDTNAILGRYRIDARVTTESR